MIFIHKQSGEILLAWNILIPDPGGEPIINWEVGVCFEPNEGNIDGDNFEFLGVL